eukprot:1137943-Pelagomonas_calceolata.AAC.2
MLLPRLLKASPGLLPLCLKPSWGVKENTAPLTEAPCREVRPRPPPQAPTADWPPSGQAGCLGKDFCLDGGHCGPLPTCIPARRPWKGPQAQEGRWTSAAAAAAAAAAAGRSGSWTPWGLGVLMPGEWA